MRGHEQKPIDGVQAGDIGVVTKLTVTTTNDTLCDRGTQYRVPPVEYPEPLYSVAVFPSTKADLDKLGSSLSRLVEEDPTLRVERNTETNETILSGMGESHIQIATRRLANKFGVQVDTDLPKIPYRETITKSASAQGATKQTGGRGHLATSTAALSPWSAVRALSLGCSGFSARSFFPAVEKRSARSWRGVLAGYPPCISSACFTMVLIIGGFVRNRLQAPRISSGGHAAGGGAAGAGLQDRDRPRKVHGRRSGRSQLPPGAGAGYGAVARQRIVTAEVPLANQRYAADLRSMTQGAVCTMEFVRYDIVPAHLIDQIKADAERRQEKEKTTSTLRGLNGQSCDCPFASSKLMPVFTCQDRSMLLWGHASDLFGRPTQSRERHPSVSRHGAWWSAHHGWCRRRWRARRAD